MFTSWIGYYSIKFHSIGFLIPEKCDKIYKYDDINIAVAIAVVNVSSVHRILK